MIQILPCSDSLPGYETHKETIAHWLYSEFIHNIRPGITFQDVLNRFTNPVPGTFPARFSAMDGSQCVGTASLVQNDLSFRDYSPWLASLFVDPKRRNEGIGRLLIEKVKETTWEMGYDTLYLRTEFAGAYYRKLGWIFVEQCADEFGLEPEVYRWVK